MFDDMGTFWPLPDNLGLIKMLGKPLVEHVIQRLFEKGVKEFTLVFKHSVEKVKFEVDVLIDYARWDELDSLEGPIMRAYDIFLAEGFSEDLYNFDIIDRFNNVRLWHSKRQESKTKITMDLNELKYPWHLLDIMNVLLNDIKRKIHPDAFIDDNVLIKGNVFIDKGAKIFGNTVLVGPLYIGQNVIVGNCSLVRQGIIEANSLVGARIEIARSLLLEESETHSGYIGDSIFSYKSHAGAEFVTANLRLDRGPIYVKIGGERINTRRNKLGAIIGENTEIGVNVSIMPGILIGKNSLIGPGTVVFENVPDNTKYYARYEIMMKPI